MSRSDINRRYYEKNKETISAKTKAHRSDPEVKARRAAASKAHRLSAQYDPEKFVNFLFGNVKSGAKNRGLKVEITKEDITELCIESNGKCAISGLPLSSEYNSPYKASVDRIDSSKGYTRKNVQLVASMVNIAKNKYTMGQFVEMCKAVARKHK